MTAGTVVVCVMNAVLGGAAGYFLGVPWQITSLVGLLIGGAYGFWAGRNLGKPRRGLHDDTI